MMPRRRTVRLGIRDNLAQFSLLAVVNAFVGAMVGMERTILPFAAIGDVAPPSWRALRGSPLAPARAAAG